jgi:hypothetical protein
VPVVGGVRFLTWYDYEVRFGRLGRAVDAVAFRPLIGFYKRGCQVKTLFLFREEGMFF